MMRSGLRQIVCLIAAAWALAGVGGEAGAQTESDSKPAAPITYQFNDPNPRVKNSVYAVYQADGVTMMVRHPRQENPQFDKPTWYASEATDGRLVRVLQAHRPVLVKPGSGDYKPGTKERRRRRSDVYYVAYDELETKLVRGEDDREVAGKKTQHYVLHVSFEGKLFDEEGETLEQEKYAHEHHLWVAKDLPYSPAFALPFRIIGRLFVADDSTKLGEYIYDQVRPKLRDKGLVMRMEFRQKGQKTAKYVLEAERIARAKDRSAKLPSYPIVDEASFASITPLTIVSRMLEPADEKAAKESSFELTYSGDASGTVKGTAVWGTNKHGDFALLLSLPMKFGDGGGGEAATEQLFLLLMRPMHGRPEKGEYEVADVVDDIESLSTDELERLSEQFTVMGVIRETRKDAAHPDVYALTEAKAGTITVSEETDQLDGKLSLELRGLALSDKASEATVDIEATFSAKKALENVGSSTITQVLTR